MAKRADTPKIWRAQGTMPAQNAEKDIPNTPV